MQAEEHARVFWKLRTGNTEIDTEMAHSRAIFGHGVAIANGGIFYAAIYQFADLNYWNDCSRLSDNL